MTPPVTVVVPTLGRSPHLPEVLARLRTEGAEVVLVDQAPGGVGAETAALAHRVLLPTTGLGFAAAVNLGLDGAGGDLVGTVNDDALPEPGWLASLVALLEQTPEAAAAQAIQVVRDDETKIDGAGITWNRWWQAVQRDRGRPPPSRHGSPIRIFGASATAVLYRRAALGAAALDGAPFDPRLGSYYEDVDLAVRLRAAGWTALVTPAIHVTHAGSLTGATLGWRRERLIYGNRLLVLARLSGRSFGRRLPRALARDVADLGRRTGARATGSILAIPAGWLRAMRHLGHFLHAGPPVPVGESS